MIEPATARWRRLLEEWALPDDLLAAVPECPYGWSPELWKRREQIAREQDTETPTSAIVRSLMPDRGSLLDVGAGTGRASLPHATEGYRLTAIEKNPELAAGLRQRSAHPDLAVAVIEGVWPEVATAVAIHDLAMCAHVVYDVQDIKPFLAALAEHARAGVVVELTPDHPWSGLTPYYRALHNLERPDGPTYQDFVSVVEQVCGAQPQVEVWTRPGQVWFENWDEILDHYQKRLVLPRHRRKELRDLLGPDVEEDAGRFYVGSRERTLVTVWWRVGP